jgi:Fe-S-cluster containining protein
MIPARSGSISTLMAALPTEGAIPAPPPDFPLESPLENDMHTPLESGGRFQRSTRAQRSPPGIAPLRPIQDNTFMSRNPCLSCGACCAYYRASFYCAETDDATPAGVPKELTSAFPPHRRVMKGTESIPSRCIALRGEIGRAVECAMHPRRATVCRDFVPSFRDGQPNPRCDTARLAWDLSPLQPGDWQISHDPGELEPGVELELLPSGPDHEDPEGSPPAGAPGRCGPRRVA